MEREEAARERHDVDPRDALLIERSTADIEARSPGAVVDEQEDEPNDEPDEKERGRGYGERGSPPH